MFSVLAAHTCSWIIARLGTEIAACGHDPKDQEDTQKKKITSPALGKVSPHAEQINYLFLKFILCKA